MKPTDPVFPIAVEASHYRRKDEEGGALLPLRRETIELQTDERVCLARLMLRDAEGKAASIFLAAILDGDTIVIEASQDQTDFKGGDDHLNVVRRDFKVKFFQRGI